MSGKSPGAAVLVKQLTLYTGPSCHLCEQAKTILYPLMSQQGWELVEVNIQESEDLKQRYGIRIPVVALPDGSEKGWPFTAAQIGRLLDV
ncbi:MAG: glutaredoxin family protein [Porticoccaceae bacterium]|jgi:glutaredoxin|nr:glutaredoxin family protein [Porticoccaceae bacterium]